MKKTAVLITALMFCIAFTVQAHAASDPKGTLGYKWGDKIEAVKQKAKNDGFTYISQAEADDIEPLTLNYTGDVFGYKKVEISFMFNDNQTLTGIGMAFQPNAAAKLEDMLKKEFSKKKGNTLRLGRTYINSWGGGKENFIIGFYSAEMMDLEDDPEPAAPKQAASMKNDFPVIEGFYLSMTREEANQLLIKIYKSQWAPPSAKYTPMLELKPVYIDGKAKYQSLSFYYHNHRDRSDRTDYIQLFFEPSGPNGRLVLMTFNSLFFNAPIEKFSDSEFAKVFGKTYNVQLDPIRKEKNGSMIYGHVYPKWSVFINNMRHWREIRFILSGSNDM